jgi:hypothetical protein
MEELHDHAPKLEKITLYCNAISGNSARNMVISTDRMTVLDVNGVETVKHPANSVKYLEIEFFLDLSHGSTHNVTEALKNVMIRWLTYVSCKYNQTNHLMLKGYLFSK